MEPTPGEATILIVEDERSNLISLERIFQREGYRTLLAEDGRAALDLCRRHRVDVVLTDLKMPNMSGIDVIKALDTVAPDAEVVVMTAWTKLLRLEAFDEASAAAFIDLFRGRGPENRVR